LIASLALIFVQCGETKVTHDAWASMARKKMVSIATNAVNVPFEFGEGTGVQGFDVDLGGEIAKDLGYPVKWVKIDEFGRLFEIMKNGEVEMIISTVARTPERETEFAFSEPYFDTSNTIARRIDNQTVKDIVSLAGKRVGVQTGRTGDTFMTSQKAAANVTLTRFKTLDDALGALNRGEIDAVVGDKPIITYSIAKSYSTNLITTDVDVTTNQYAVVVRPEETKLLAKINETIARLKNSGALSTTMHDKWFQTVLKDATKNIKELEEQERLKAAPKSIAVNLIKLAGSPVRMDRLDGFNVELVGPGGTFKSTSIETNEEAVKGGCRFPTPIPPGEYRFVLSRLSVNQTITVEKKPVTSFTVTLTFKKEGLEFTWK
jgi:polar amino acid transport system substrate-binding protein